MSQLFSHQWRYFVYWANCTLLWRGNYRPARMFTRGRPLDPEFASEEWLYFRCMAEWIECGRIKPANVHFPDQSVNRQKYSRPRDVLLPDDSEESCNWLLWGVVGIQVRDLPPEMRTGGGIPYSFPVEHDPLPNNYSHSELRVFKNGVRETSKGKINNQIKKEYRTRLALRTSVIVSPLV